MKIFSLSVVKNESDIIESFVRYNCSILDGMLIIDHNSSDNTKIILELLQKEGYPLMIYSSNDVSHNQDLLMTEYMYKLYESENPDLILFLDADEFIISTNNNPRKVLEKLPQDKLYLSKWRTYVPYNMNENLFIPSKIQYCRKEEYEHYYKIIIPAKLLEDKNLMVMPGNHDIIGISNKEKLNNIYIAHFPVRSKEQLISKIVNGCLNYLSLENLEKRQGFHWFRLYEKIKMGQELDLVKIGKYYDIKEISTQNVEIELNPLVLDFCDNITIKYSSEKINFLNNIINNCEHIITNYSIITKELMKKDVELQQKQEKQLILRVFRKIQISIKK